MISMLYSYTSQTHHCYITLVSHAKVPVHRRKKKLYKTLHIYYIKDHTTKYKLDANLFCDTWKTS